MTALVHDTRLDSTRRGEEVEITHLVCCCDDTAQCGWDVTDDPWADDDDDTDDCVVCRDLWGPPGAPCPRCGCEGC